MDRFTRTVDNNHHVVDEALIKHGDDGYFGDAVERLARFEDVYQDLLKKQDGIIREMDKLKAEGKTKTVRFKQLLANKMTNSNIIILFQSYGLK